MKQFLAWKWSRTRVLCFIFCVLSAMNISCGTDRMDLQESLNNRAFQIVRNRARSIRKLRKDYFG